MNVSFNPQLQSQNKKNVSFKALIKKRCGNGNFNELLDRIEKSKPARKLIKSLHKAGFDIWSDGECVDLFEFRVRKQNPRFRKAKVKYDLEKNLADLRNGLDRYFLKESLKNLIDFCKKFMKRNQKQNVRIWDSHETSFSIPFERDGIFGPILSDELNSIHDYYISARKNDLHFVDKLAKRYQLARQIALRKGISVGDIHPKYTKKWARKTVRDN